RLAAHLKMARDQVLRTYCRKLGERISLKESRTADGQYPCIFLTEKRTCSIYPVRPLQCRTWPFWDGILKTPEKWEATSKGCPGMNKGKHYTSDQIEALRDAEDWPR